MTAWGARIGGPEWARESGRLCAATHAPDAPAQQYTAILLEGWGPHNRTRPAMICGAGPDHPWDAVAEEWLQAAPEPKVGWIGDVSSLIRAPPPPRIVLHTANVLRATEMHTWGHNAATILWLSPGARGAWLTVAHSKNGGPVYDDALSWPGDVPGPLLLMPPTNLAAALRQELDSCEGLRVGWEAVADATYWPSSTGTRRSSAGGAVWCPTSLGATHIWQPPPPGPPLPSVG